MAHVQSATTYDGGPITLTGVTAGNCLVAYVQGDSSMASTTLPAPWAKQTVAQSGSGMFCCQWVYTNHPGGNPSVTITSAPGDPGWSIDEYSGRDTTNAVEDSDVASGTGTTWTSTAVTATDGADVVFGCGNETSAVTITITAPATRRTLQSSHVHATGDKVNVAAGSITGTGTVAASSTPWAAVSVSLKSDGSPAPSFPVVEGTAESSVDTAGTSHLVTLPASIASTDLVLITMDIGSTSATLNSLTDWAEDLDEAAANGLKILRYTGTGVPGNPTFTSSASTRSASIAWRISNADKTIAPQIGTTAAGTSATPDPPSVTPTGGISKDFLFIAFYGAAGEEADDDTWSDTPPSGYTPTPPLQKACGTVGTNLGGMIAAAYRQLTTGAAQDPGTFAKDVSAAWRAQTIIIHPIVAGGTDGTATPAVIARSFAVPDVTETAGSTITPAVIARAFALPAPTAQAGSAPAPAVIARAFALPAPTLAAGSTITPAVIARAFALPAPTAQSGTVVSPALIARAFALPAPTTQAGAVVSPAVMAQVFTLPAPAATGGGSATATPTVIAQLFTLPAATAQAGSVVSPALIARLFTLPAPTTAAGATRSPAVIAQAFLLPAPTLAAGAVPNPAVIALTFTVPAPAASGGGSITATPAVIAQAFTLPAPALVAGSVRTVAVIARAFALPPVTAQAGATKSPAVIARLFVLPAPTATGGASSTANPAVIARAFALPAVALVAGSIVSPATIVLAFALPGVVPAFVIGRAVSVVVGPAATSSLSLDRPTSVVVGAGASSTVIMED